MKRYYKIPKTSATGAKITEIMRKRDLFIKKIKAFIDKYHVIGCVRSDFDWIGVAGVRFASSPDKVN